MLAKRLLPHYGGAAAVWATSMFFFQAALLAGYACADWIRRRSSARLQALLYGIGVALGVAALPLLPTALERAPAGLPPALQVLVTLATAIGLPFLWLAAASPLLQAWFAAAGAGAGAYRLYAVSNGASLAALIAYPFVIEPRWALSKQLQLWALGYALFSALSLMIAFTLSRLAVFEESRSPVAFSERLLWMGLAATPCALWIGIATQISLNIAAVPLLWILPLSVYLLTLILCFSGDAYNPALFRRLFPVGVACLVVVVRYNDWGRRVEWAALLALAGLFICAMVCHGELVRRKPDPARMTSFYLMVAAGGAAGGAFSGLLAPVIFPVVLELPIAIVAAILLAAALLYQRLKPAHLARMAVLATAAFLAASLFGSRHRLRSRNFYGLVEVRKESGAAGPYLALYNGAILHGAQYLDAKRRCEPATYYTRGSGIGVAFSELPQNRPRRIGAVGLGAGAIACYAHAGDWIRFYEINPEVIRIARSQFTFLRETPAQVETVLGDGRLALEREPPQAFDILVIDAFSGDAVPVHLLSTEAFRLYLRHLAAGGILAVHVSNRYVNLIPVVTAIALAIGRDARIVATSEDFSKLQAGSTWILLKDARPPLPVPAVWTDDYSNILEVLR